MGALSRSCERCPAWRPGCFLRAAGPTERRQHTERAATAATGRCRLSLYFSLFSKGAETRCFYCRGGPPALFPRAGEALRNWLRLRVSIKHLDEPQSSRSSLLWRKACCSSLARSSPRVRASGHTRRCLRHPTGETPGRRGNRACSPTSARDRRPSGDLGGESVAAVRVLAGRCLSRFSGRVPLTMP